MSSRLDDQSVSTASGSVEVDGVRDEETHARWVRRVCLLLRVDGAFEALLGALLLLSPVTGLYSTLELPGPASRPVVVVVGLFLLPLLPILWRESLVPRRQVVLMLAAANGAGAVLFTAWVLLWNGTFDRAGAIFVLLVAAILAVLATLQARETIFVR